MIITAGYHVRQTRRGVVIRDEFVGNTLTEEGVVALMLRLLAGANYSGGSHAGFVATAPYTYDSPGSVDGPDSHTDYGYVVGFIADDTFVAVSDEDMHESHAGWTEHPLLFRDIFSGTSGNRYTEQSTGKVTTGSTYVEHAEYWLRDASTGEGPDPYSTDDIHIKGFFLINGDGTWGDETDKVIFSVCALLTLIVFQAGDTMELNWELRLS